MTGSLKRAGGLVVLVAFLANAQQPPGTVDPELRRELERDVSLGYSKSELVRSAMLGREEADRPMVMAAIAAAEARHAQLAKQWKGKTDCDRLVSAFAALEKQGVLTRERFSMTTTSGHLEAQKLLADARASGRKVTGYVFYTPQDLETVFEDKGLWLTFGSDDLDQGDATARKLLAALEKVGLEPEWSGGPTKVWLPLEWRRRR